MRGVGEGTIDNAFHGVGSGTFGGGDLPFRGVGAGTSGELV